MNDNKVTISVSISKPLLKDIIETIEGKNRSRKLEKCISEGYNFLTKEE